VARIIVAKNILLLFNFTDLEPRRNVINMDNVVLNNGIEMPMAKSTAYWSVIHRD